MVWDGVGGVGRCGVVWDGVGLCGVVWDGVGLCGTVWGGVGLCGICTCSGLGPQCLWPSPETWTQWVPAGGQKGTQLHPARLQLHNTTFAVSVESTRLVAMGRLAE